MAATVVEDVSQEPLRSTIDGVNKMSPDEICGRISDFIDSEPYRSIIHEVIADSTIGTGASVAPSSSSRTARSEKEKPAPPNSSGIISAGQPSSNIRFHNFSIAS